MGLQMFLDGLYPVVLCFYSVSILESLYGQRKSSVIFFPFIILPCSINHSETTVNYWQLLWLLLSCYLSHNGKEGLIEELSSWGGVEFEDLKSWLLTSPSYYMLELRGRRLGNIKEKLWACLGAFQCDGNYLPLGENSYVCLLHTGLIFSSAS